MIQLTFSKDHPGCFVENRLGWEEIQFWKQEDKLEEGEDRGKGEEEKKGRRGRRGKLGEEKGRDFIC